MLIVQKKLPGQEKVMGIPRKGPGEILKNVPYEKRINDIFLSAHLLLTPRVLDWITEA